ncbi:RNA polymerase sigma factor [Mucilaginibacter sp. PPCGB 2223]|uniref:RNA polymerase sigma factor n=1 Tax=Mucilaginibacter sp. PPCGB 2223 TaxID=1886027 RepID=UPI0011123E59|nr:RNA polymerase sigma factor [Mucilaginibacter sp. PPCGB 2223]
MNINDQLSDWWNESLQGNIDSFGCIHCTLHASLYHYLIKILKDEDTCEDVLQDMFVKLWERKERLGPISFVKVYFFRCARSMAINHLKNKHNQNVPLAEDMDVDVVFSHEEILVKKEHNLQMSHMLTTALNDLPKRQREMIFLKYFDGWKYEEIAQVTGINYQSVVNHVHRGILQLRTNMVDNRFSRAGCMAFLFIIFTKLI